MFPTLTDISAITRPINRLAVTAADATEALQAVERVFFTSSGGSPMDNAGIAKVTKSPATAAVDRCSAAMKAEEEAFRAVLAITPTTEAGRAIFRRSVGPGSSGPVRSIRAPLSYRSPRPQST